jgi:hypothetical protein
MRPQPRMQNEKAYEHSHHGHTGNHPAFPAQWFYGLLRALPGDQACLTPSPARLLADLTPALGRQNDTTSPYASAVRHTRRRVHRIPRSTSVTIAKRPSEEAGPNRYSADFTPPSSLISENRKLVPRAFVEIDCRGSGKRDLKRHLVGAHRQSGQRTSALVRHSGFKSDTARGPKSANRRHSG